MVRSLFEKTVLVRYNFAMVMLTLTWISIGCWLVCFWWMHRISSRQNAMLRELHEVTKRIEDVSNAEHDLIREVHPQVNEIREQVENVADAVAPELSAKKSVAR